MPKTCPKRRDFHATTETPSFPPLPAAVGPRSSSSVSSPKLSAQALAIVQCEHRHVEVLACAGSGKTTVLCERVRWLIAHGVSADQILVLSFSKAAAREVRQRLRQRKSRPASVPALRSTRHGAADGAASTVTVSTCHAFGRSVLSARGKSAPDLLKPKQVDMLLTRAMTAVRRQLKSSATFGQQERSVALEFLARAAAKDQLKFVAKLFENASASRQPLTKLVAGNPMFSSLAPHAKVLRLVRTDYQRQKTASSKIDYADMLKLAADAVRRLSARSEVHVSASGPGAVLAYRYVLVDEYQDSGSAQVHLIAALAHVLPDLSVMVFGDRNQSVYRFAGAHHTPLASVLPQVAALPLSRSHRLTQPTADAATAVLRAAGAEVRPIRGRPNTASAPRPVIVSSDSLSASLDAVADDVAAKLAAGVEPSQIGVLARTNAVLREVEAQLVERQVPTHWKGRERDAEHVQNVLALVRCLERMAEHGRKPSAPDLQALLPKVRAKTGRWDKMCKAVPKIGNPTLEGRYIRCAELYLALLGGVNADRERRDEVRRWIPHCRNFADARSMRAGVKSLDQQTRVTLSTVHQAKGDEWDHVYVVGVADGQMPNYLARSREDALVEELNLMHVAATRARESLRLYFAPVRHARSHQRFDKLSRFLSDPQVRCCFDLEHR